MEPRLLIDLAALIVADAGEPRLAEDVAVALERASWVGEPVVLAGDHVAGRRLPDDPDDRVRWVRETLARDDLSVVALDGDAWTDRAMADRVVDRYRQLRDAWGAYALVTGDAASVGPARRAGLRVTRVGPRDGTGDRPVERADHEARDLLDAVNQLLVAETFATDGGAASIGDRGERRGR